LIKNGQVGKLYACSDLSIPGSVRSFDNRAMDRDETEQRG